MARKVGGQKPYRSGEEVTLAGGGVVWLNVIGPNVSCAIQEAEDEERDRRAAADEDESEEKAKALDRDRPLPPSVLLAIQKAAWLKHGVITGWRDFEDENGQPLADKYDNGDLHLDNAKIILGEDSLYMEILAHLSRLAKKFTRALERAAKN